MLEKILEQTGRTLHAKHHVKICEAWLSIRTYPRPRWRPGAIRDTPGIDRNPRMTKESIRSSTITKKQPSLAATKRENSFRSRPIDAAALSILECDTAMSLGLPVQSSGLENSGINQLSAHLRRVLSRRLIAGYDSKQHALGASQMKRRWTPIGKQMKSFGSRMTCSSPSAPCHSIRHLPSTTIKVSFVS